jgi:hypothetical protein
MRLWGVWLLAFTGCNPAGEHLLEAEELVADQNWDAALIKYEEVRVGWPESPEAQMAIAAIDRVLGRQAERFASENDLLNLLKLHALLEKNHATGGEISVPDEIDPYLMEVIRASYDNGDYASVQLVHTTLTKAHGSSAVETLFSQTNEGLLAAAQYEEARKKPFDDQVFHDVFIVYNQLTTSSAALKSSIQEWACTRWDQVSVIKRCLSVDTNIVDVPLEEVAAQLQSAETACDTASTYKHLCGEVREENLDKAIHDDLVELQHKYTIKQEAWLGALKSQAAVMTNTANHLSVVCQQLADQIAPMAWQVIEYFSTEQMSAAAQLSAQVRPLSELKSKHYETVKEMRVQIQKEDWPADVASPVLGSLRKAEEICAPQQKR